MLRISFGGQKTARPTSARTFGRARHSVRADSLSQACIECRGVGANGQRLSRIAVDYLPRAAFQICRSGPSAP